MNYTIIDNFLPESNFINFELNITSPQIMPWFLTENCGSITFSHIFYSNMRPNSEKIDLVLSVLDKLEIKALIMAKAVLHFKTTKIEKVENQKLNEFKHKSAIYFLNSNNGYVMLNKTDKIQALANRMLVFDSDALAYTTNCTDKIYNATINLDYF